MSNQFHSKRLLYRAMEDTPEDEAMVHSIRANPESISCPRQVYYVEWKNHLAEKRLIAVNICKQRLALNLAFYPSANGSRGMSNLGIVAHQGNGGGAIRRIVDWGFRRQGCIALGLGASFIRLGGMQKRGYRPKSEMIRIYARRQRKTGDCGRGVGKSWLVTRF